MRATHAFLHLFQFVRWQTKIFSLNADFSNGQREKLLFDL